jgi:thiamine pyrophosphokinase
LWKTWKVMKAMVAKSHIIAPPKDEQYSCFGQGNTIGNLSIKNVVDGTRPKVLSQHRLYV